MATPKAECVGVGFGAHHQGEPIVLRPTTKSFLALRGVGGDFELLN